MLTGSANRRGSCLTRNLFIAALIVFVMFLSAAPAFSDVEMTGFTLTQETEGGRWEIRASVAYYDGHGDVILQEVSARMINNGVERVKVVSDKGRYETDGLVLYLEGAVSVASAWGSRFETPTLKWDGPRAVMEAEGGVRLLRAGWEMSGESVSYMVNSGTATVDGGVRTVWSERSDQR